MDVFLSYDGDHIGREVGRAILTDDVEAVRRTDQAIQAGNDLWRKFAENVGGSVVEIGGDEGRICIGADHLDKVQQLAEQYAELVGATVSVGVGTKLSESARALLVAKLRGGNQILLWQDSMAQELEAVKDKPEGEKIAEEYLNKANTAENVGAHAGFEGRTEPKGGAVDKPVATQGDHSQEQAIYDTIAQAQENQVPVEQTHAAQDFEESLHQAAQEQSKKDEQSKVDAANGHEDLRKQVIGVLQKVKQSIPVLAQVKQASPETYQAVMYLVQSVVALGRELMGNEPQAMQKGEAGDDFAGPKSELSKAESQPGHVYRGITQDEHDYIAQNGHVLSNQKWSVPGEGTCFGDYDTAEDYVNFGRTSPNKTGQPTYVIEVSHGPEMSVDRRDGYTKAQAPIPSSRITKVWRFKTRENPEEGRWSSSGFVPLQSMAKAEEILGKMALIWDHQAQGGNRATIYRVANENGVGPYYHGDNDDLFSYAPSKKRPAPFAQPGADFSDQDARAFEGSDFYFGFEKPEHAASWFGKEALTRLKTRGFEIRPFQANRVWRSKSGKQVFFEPAEWTSNDPEVRGPRPMAKAEVKKSEPAPAPDRLAGGRADGRLPRDFDPIELSLGIEHELEHTKDPLIAREIAMDHLVENPKYYTQLAASGIEKKEIKEDLDKSASNGPIAGAPSHNHLHLPVGSQVNGKIKVSHGDGGTSWKSVQAGQITAQDPDAPLFGANSHPTSTREPGAK